MTILRFYAAIMFVATLVSFGAVFASHANAIVDLFFFTCWASWATFDDWEYRETHRTSFNGG